MSCCISDYPDKVCPLRMSDGRSFTNYETRCNFNTYLNNKLTQNNTIKSSNEMRLYLQNNYDSFIQEERQKAINNINPFNTNNLINNSNTELDNKYIVKCDDVSCYKVLNNPNGLGTTKYF